MRQEKTSTPEKIFSRAKHNGFRIAPGTLKQVADILPGVVHKWNSPITVVFYGPTSSGKTRLQARLYSDELAAALKLVIPGSPEAVNLLEDDASADTTEYIVRVEFKEAVTFFDSPGFQADDPRLANMSRAFAGLKQLGPAAHHVDAIQVVDTALKPLAIQKIPIAELERQYPMENPIAIYCLDPTMTPFTPGQQEETRSDILDLHEIYGESLIVVCPFKDKFDDWKKEKRDQRKEILDYALARDVLGRDRDAIACSSTTGEALSTVVKRIFAVSGQNTANFAKYITEELRGSRFQHALSNLSKLIAGGLIKNFYNEAMPYSDLFDRLIIMSGVYLQHTYSVDEDTWKRCNGKIEDIMCSPDREQLEKNVVSRRAKGWWERFQSVFGKRFSATEYTASVALVQDVCVAMYELIHTLEENIKSERVDTERVEKWFASAFAARNLQEAIQRRDLIRVQIELEGAWTECFATFHTEALDVLTQMSVKEANHAA